MSEFFPVQSADANSLWGTFDLVCPQVNTTCPDKRPGPTAFRISDDADAQFGSA